MPGRNHKRKDSGEVGSEDCNIVSRHLVSRWRSRGWAAVQKRLPQRQEGQKSGIATRASALGGEEDRLDEQQGPGTKRRTECGGGSEDPVDEWKEASSHRRRGGGEGWDGER